ncbi:unnamed protein product, partial [Iphiclides podalirius]
MRAVRVVTGRRGKPVRKRGGGYAARTKGRSSNVPPRCPLISNKQGGGLVRRRPRDDDGTSPRRLSHDTGHEYATLHQLPRQSNAPAARDYSRAVHAERRSEFAF